VGDKGPFDGPQNSALARYVGLLEHVGDLLMVARVRPGKFGEQNSL
jgi:hypothetical protein